MKKSIVAKVLAFSLAISSFVGINPSVASAEESVPTVDDTTQISTEEIPIQIISNEFDETTGNYKYSFITSLKSGTRYQESLTSADLGVSVTPNVRPDVEAVPDVFTHEASNGVTYEYNKVTQKDEYHIYVFYKSSKKVETESTVTPIPTSTPIVTPSPSPNVSVSTDNTTEKNYKYVKAPVDESNFEKCIGWYDGELVRQSEMTKAMKLYKKYKNKKKIVIKTNSKLETRRIQACLYYKYARYAEDACFNWSTYPEVESSKKVTIKTKNFKKFIKYSKKQERKKTKRYKLWKKRQNWMTKFMNCTIKEAEAYNYFDAPKDYEVEWNDKLIKQCYNGLINKGIKKAIAKNGVTYNYDAANYHQGKSKNPSPYGNGQTIWEVIDYQTVVCAGIARFTEMCFESLGIKCKCVCSKWGSRNHLSNKLPEGYIGFSIYDKRTKGIAKAEYEVDNVGVIG